MSDLYKILLVGDSGVGKSSMLARFTNPTSEMNILPTTGIDFRIRTLQIDDRMIKLQIFDTAGQERFRTVTNSYYRGANGIILVYDVTDKESFRHAWDWKAEIERYAKPSIPMLLVGNKCDVRKERQVQKEDAEKFANIGGMLPMEVSAKENQNIEAAFRALVCLMIMHQQHSIGSVSVSVSVSTCASAPLLKLEREENRCCC